MRIVIRDEGRTVPRILGLDLAEVAGVTVRKIEERVGQESTENALLVLYKDSFVPPDGRVISLIQELIFSGKRNVDVGGVFSVILEPSEKQYVVELTLESCFRIMDGDDFARAVKIVRDIKNSEVCKRAFLYSPETTFISLDSEIGDDTVIYPYTFIFSSRIGRSVRIHQGSTLVNCTVGDNAEILPYCHIDGAELESDVKIGPFSRIRPYVRVRRGAKVGNFAEIKNSEIGENTKIQHFSYVGDATIGRNVNIGAGTVTCNYDGKNKNKTTIEDGVFVGSGSMLIAPLRLGRNCYVGAGSSISKDVPPYALAVERAEMRLIPEWVRKKKLSADT